MAVLLTACILFWAKRLDASLVRVTYACIQSFKPEILISQQTSRVQNRRRQSATVLTAANSFSQAAYLCRLHAVCPYMQILRHKCMQEQDDGPHLYHFHSTPASVKMFLWLPQVGLERYTLVPFRNLAMKSAPTLREPVPDRDWTHAIRFCRTHKVLEHMICLQGPVRRPVAECMCCSSAGQDAGVFGD